MTILSAHATRRDAKSYFGRFGQVPTEAPIETKGIPTLSTSLRLPLHTALIKICQANTLSSVDMLPKLAKTIVHLGRLGMPSCLVVEPKEDYAVSELSRTSNAASLREHVEYMVYRIAEAIDAKGGRAQPLIGDILTKIEPTPQVEAKEPSGVGDKLEQVIDDPSISLPTTSMNLLYRLLSRNTIPVIAPLAGGINPSISPISGNTAIYRICTDVAKDPEFAQKLSIERIIIIDPIGGLPAQERRGGSHLYINLQQEYNDMLEQMSANLLLSAETSLHSKNRLHLRNLVLVNMCLKLLSSTSSALITTPRMAASQASQSAPQSLIHNLLTDKPLISPSLPRRRASTPISETTLLRLGLPVKIYTSMAEKKDDMPPLSFTRLVELIEDSFGRRLDVDRYWKRLENKTAAIIIAGDYEGAAIVTKETLPGLSGWIPYLDKFAVSGKSQGSRGVADIVFNVLTSVFPDDLIWRSRKTNPVNKWVKPQSPPTLFP